MDAFAKPAFSQAIVGMGEAYGGLSFWPENLNPAAHPDAIWRGLLYNGSRKAKGFEHRIRPLLIHKDSRVRGWACFALGQLGDEASLEQVRAMNADPLNRVRVHAWQALQAMVGEEESTVLLQIVWKGDIT